MYYRNCPKCENETFYTKKCSRVKAEKENRNCRSCSKKGENNPNYEKFGENNHNFGISRTEETKEKIKEKRKLQIMKPFSNESKRKMSESKLGNKNPAKRPEVRKKISESLKGGKRSEKTKLKMRQSAKKRIEKQYGHMYPNHNSDACRVIDEYSKKYGYNFQHAENGGEVCIGGYFPDGIDKKKKVIIEIDEKHHFNPDGTYKQRDVERQEYFEKEGYEMIRIKFRGK